MELTGLYELLERFHRSNQLPAFLIGFISALALAFFVLRWFRRRLLNVRGGSGELKALEKRVNELNCENKQLQKDLRHTEKHAEVIKVRISELSGLYKAQKEISSSLSVACERQKERVIKENQERRRLLEAYRKSRRQVASLDDQLHRIAVCDGRIWEVAVGSGVTPFRSLSQRRTPIISFVNLKGGVGKTTVSANLAIAMNEYGWRVLVVDLDYQSSISQLLLSPGEMDELIVSRRLIHETLADDGGGVASFRRAICRVTKVPKSEIYLVAADEELGNLETALAHRWQAKLTADDIRFRLRTVLQSAEIADRFDFILLDCPPRLTTACVNALSASDYAVVPVLPNPTSTAAVPRLLKWLRLLRQNTCPELSVMGVIGNKAKYYGEAVVSKQHRELKSLADLCQDVWGEPVMFFPPMRTHEPLSQTIPNLDPKVQAAYLDFARQLNEELPNYARSRSPRLSSGVNDPVGSIRG